MPKFSLLSTNSNTQNQVISLDKDFTHAMITGQTGSGKTTSAILPILDERIKAGHGILAFDYKGSEHLKIKALARRHKRMKDVVMINVPWGKNVNIASEADESILIKFFSKIFGAKSDPFWANMATSLATKNLTILKVIKEFHHMGFSGFYSATSSALKKEFEPSMANLFNYTQNITQFKKLYNKVQKYQDLLSDPKDTMSKFHPNLSTQEKKSLLSSTPEAICVLECLEKIAKDYLDTFEEYNDINNPNLEQKEKFYGNYSFMLLALTEIADSELLNSSDTHISQLLNDGKIVIINSQNLSNHVLELMLNSVLSSMIKRIGQDEKKPISIFIDEAQRVISEESDLHADVLREAQAELILAFQNEDVLKNSLGSDTKYKQLVGNLSHQYFFKNSQKQYAGGEYKSFSNLEKFECYYGGETFKTEPLFISVNEQLKAEYIYQILNRVQRDYGDKRLKSRDILVYNEAIYKNYRQLIVKNIRGGQARFCVHLSNQSKHRLNRLLSVA
ncbi:hypothetical protein [Campylobacter suis]|uniref:Type IV secretion system coupling protein TraD DNA-binding domain-containing protein n=1 Tax=Campylobacter suis TaxID=2790657 RepID=A0ABN7K9A5_9BACT|nr:hypothetical protein [Campylobacter suis]CAD7289036.1 hypothetical protein LMG8286_01621 [Campylobacter suis]